MTTKKTKRKNRERRLSSARETAAKSGTFERTTLNVPDGCTFFKPKKAGVYRLDIIPYEVTEKGNPNAEPGVLHYERTFYVHRGVGANNESYVCPAKTSGKKCPICEHRAKLAKDPDTDEELIRTLSPKKRQLFNVIPLDGDSAGDVQVWDESYHLFGKHLVRKINEADEEDQDKFDKFHDPENGLTLRVGVSEESGAGYSYYDASNIEFKERKKSYDEDIVDKAYNLDEMIREPSYAELKKVFLQEEAEDEEDDEDEDDTEEAEDEDEDEDEPKAKSKSKAKKSVKKSKTKDEDEDEDDDEEEQEEDEDEEDDEEVDEADEESDEEEDEDEDDSDVTVGSTVKFKYRGEWHTGKVKRVRNGLCHVKCSDRNDPYIVDPDDCKIVEAEEEEEEKPKSKKDKKSTKSKAKTKSKDDEDEEEDEDEDED